MQVLHTALLVGDFDWNPERVSREEFEGRLAAVKALMAEKGWDALIVYGDAAEHGNMVYLTNALPKLRASVAMVTADGKIRVLAAGAPNMLPSFKRLSWVEDVKTFRDPGKEITDFLTENGLAGKKPTVAVLGADQMRQGFYDNVVKGCGGDATLVEADAEFGDLVRAKRPRERELIRTACSILEGAVDAMARGEAVGDSAVQSVLDGERAARHAGAQDVRSLFSLDGGKVLRPFEVFATDRVDPLVAYLAIKYAGYWVDGMVTLSEAPNKARAAAADGLAALIAAAKPGATGADLAKALSGAVGGLALHPMVRAGVGNGVGISLHSAPLLNADGSEALRAGDIVTLRSGVSDADVGHALLSAIVEIGESGAEAIWSGA